MSSSSDTQPEPSPRRWLMLVIALCAPFLSVVDFFIVNITVPVLQRDLSASFASIELVMAGYGLSYAVFVITGGRLGDILGRKRMFLWGMASFTFASLLCGLAPSALALIAARVLQGLTAAAMLPQVMSIIQVSFPPEERSRAFAYFGVVVSLAAVVGQYLGGVLVDVDLFGLGWRAIFLVNLPIGALAWWSARRWLEESRGTRRVALDWGGVLLASLGLALLLVPLVDEREGLPAWKCACLALAPVVIALFFFYERRVAARGGDALLDPALLRVRSFVIGLSIIVAFSSGQASFFLTMTLTLQRGAGLDALHTAQSFTPFAAGVLCASMISARFARSGRNRFLYAGIGLMGLGLATLLVGITRLDIAAHPAFVMCAIGSYGFGQGCTTPTLYGAILHGVPHALAGAASGVLGTVQQVAASFGIAGIGMIFVDALGTGSEPASYLRAASHALWANLALITLALVLVFLLPGLHGSVQTASDEPLVIDHADLP